jgi:hypothetical protein
MDSKICLIDKLVFYYNVIIVALAVQRRAEGASHSANTLTPGINSRETIEIFVQKL